MEYYKITGVRLGSETEGRSYMWLVPDTKHCRSQTVLDVERFEEQLSDWWTLRPAALRPCSLAELRAGVRVCLRHESKWVRGEVLGCNVVDMTTSVFLVDYGVMVTQPINNFYRIPERIQAPMGDLAKKMIIRDGALTPLEMFILSSDNRLKVKVDSHLLEFGIPGDFLLSLTPDLNMFKKLPFNSGSGDGSVWEILFSEFVELNANNVNDDELVGEPEFLDDPTSRINYLKKKLAAVKTMNGQAKAAKPKVSPENNKADERRKMIKDKLLKSRRLQTAKVKLQGASEEEGLDKSNEDGGSQVYSNAILSISEEVKKTNDVITEKADCFESSAGAQKMLKIKESTATVGNEIDSNIITSKICSIDRIPILRKTMEECKHMSHEQNHLKTSISPDGIMNVNDDQNLIKKLSESEESEEPEVDPIVVRREFKENQIISVRVEGTTKHDPRLAGSCELLKPMIHSPPGHPAPRRPYDKVGDLHCGDKMLRFLSSHGVTTATSIQTAMWPAVSRLSSLVAVAGPGLGKTLGWAVPLVAGLAAGGLQRPGLAPGHSPVAVVLGPGVAATSALHDTLTELSGGAGLSLAVLQSCSGAPDPQLTDFINGVDILVTTPLRLLKLLNEERMIGLERCCHLILEDADTVLAKWPKETSQIMSTWKKSKGSQNSLDQLIVVSEKWTEEMEGFTSAYLKPQTRPIVAIANLLEAAIYGKIEVIPCCIDETVTREKALRDIIRHEKPSSRRIVVCCSHYKSSRRIHQIFAEMGIQSLLVNSDVDIADMKMISEAWSQSASSPLVVADDSLPSLPFPGADRGVVLVHWDIPSTSKTSFSHRFVFVKTSLRNTFSGHQPQGGRVHVLLSADDGGCLNTIVPFLRRCGAEIPATLLALQHSLRLRNARRSAAAGSSLCLNLVTTGSCVQEKTGKCKDRHFVSKDLDTPDPEEVPDVIKFAILGVETPVVYWVKLLKPGLDVASDQLALRMARYYSSEAAQKPLETLELNMMVAVAGQDGVYRRARLQEMVYEVKDEQEKLVAVTVFLVDAGVQEEVPLADIAELGPEFGLAQHPAAAVRVVVGGVVPGDGDTSWGGQASLQLVAGLTAARGREAVCRGRVVLRLAGLLVVDRCQLLERQPVLASWVCRLETVAALLDTGHAARDPRPVNTLISMADQAGITTHKPSLSAAADMSLELAEDGESESRTAMLDPEETVAVYMSECISPGRFYLTLAATAETLQKLEAEMMAWVAAEPRRGYCGASVGELVAVLDSSTCRRGQVREVRACNVNTSRDTELIIQNTFLIFFLDSGECDSVPGHNVFKCDPDFMTKVPFQAIPCCLGQVHAANGRWSDEAGDRLFELTRSPDDEAEVLECNLLSQDGEGVSCVQLRAGTCLAADLVAAGHADWDTCSISSLDTSASVRDEEVEAPNGVDTDILDMEKLKEVTHRGLQDYLEDNIAAVDESACLPSICTAVEGLSVEPKFELETVSSKDPKPISPTSIPSLAVLENSQYHMKTPNILWSQTDQHLSLNVKFYSALELSPEQIHLKVERKSVKVEAIEMVLAGSDGASIVVHSLPLVELQAAVVPSLTQVLVRGQGVTLKLTKEQQGSWPQLCVGKFSWIQKDPDMIQEQAEFQENASKIKTVDVCDAAFEFNLDDSNSDIDVSDEDSFDGNKIENEIDVLLR